MSSLKMVKLLGASWIGAFRVAQKHGKHVFGILILLTMVLCNLVLLSTGGLIEISSRKLIRGRIGPHNLVQPIHSSARSIFLSNIMWDVALMHFVD